MTKEQQMQYNILSGAKPVKPGKPDKCGGNPFQVLRSQFDREEKYPAHDEQYLEPMVLDAPPLVVLPRRKRQDVAIRREILRVRGALRPVFHRYGVVPLALAVGRRNLRHVDVLARRPVQHLDEEILEDVVPDAPPLRLRDPEDEGPGNHIIGYRDRRMLNTEFTEHDFDRLDFIGKWNSARVGKGFVKHFGFHFNERSIKVRLPASLVAEMKDWWTNRERDDAWENYQLSVARCRVLVSELAITAEQQYFANLYAPAIGFGSSWDRQQQVSRVVQGAHFDMRAYSWPKFKEAIKTKVGKPFTGAVVAVLATSVIVLGTIAGVILYKALGMNAPGFPSSEASWRSRYAATGRILLPVPRSF